MTNYLTRNDLWKERFMMTHSVRELSPSQRKVHGGRGPHEWCSEIDTSHPLGSKCSRKQKGNTQTNDTCAQSDSYSREVSQE